MQAHNAAETASHLLPVAYELVGTDGQLIRSYPVKAPTEAAASQAARAARRARDARDLRYGACCCSVRMVMG
jgi:hypothetical protein